MDLQELQRLARQGHTNEQIILGSLYFTGEGGVDLDYKKAELWFKLAVNNGRTDAPCCFALGIINKRVHKNYKEAIYWLELAAKQRHPIAQFELGEMYYLGEGVINDYEEAMYWYEQSAEQGYELAQYRLGEIYDLGNGVKCNLNKAIYWYLQAAEQGYKLAQNNLRCIILPNPNILSSLGEAAEQGNQDAKKMLGRILNQLR